MNNSNRQETAVRPKMTITDFLRARTQFLIDPIVAFLARYRLSPDLLTVLGVIGHFLIAWLIAEGRMQWAAAAMLLIAPLDALDGALARKLGRLQGGFGAFLDSTLDRLAEIILFGGFIFYYVRMDQPGMLGVAYIAISGSIMVSYARARAEALGFDCKVGVLSRVERYVVMMLFLVLNRPDVVVIILAIFTYVTVFQRMFHVWRQARRQSKP